MRVKRAMGTTAVLAGFLLAGAAGAEPPKDFKEAMQSLDQDFRTLTSAVMREEYEAIQAAAEDVADHPRPPLAFRKRVMGILGPQAAERQDLQGVMRQFHRVSQGCVDCHTAHRQTVQEGLAQ